MRSGRSSIIICHHSYMRNRRTHPYIDNTDRVPSYSSLLKVLSFFYIYIFYIYIYLQKMRDGRSRNQTSPPRAFFWKRTLYWSLESNQPTKYQAGWGHLCIPKKKIKKTLWRTRKERFFYIYIYFFSSQHKKIRKRRSRKVLFSEGELHNTSGHESQLVGPVAIGYGVQQLCEDSNSICGWEEKESRYYSTR